ncbi:MAG TPA: glycoside hydrolase family 3 N-terminal domain-containing protein [Thermoanaerobaculia bacterium]|jgi:beta-N-acetylhexosaminidase|nr:glycoside hydrolase family 3 N-terminal domain-containing protein [Thermoanaerobaculia bacterium]
MSTDLLGIGLTSTSLTDLERRILAENTPYAVVIFGRNIGEADEFRELTAEIKSLAPSAPPLLMIDEEGGRVDRLRHLIPGLPSVQAFAEGAEPQEMSRWSGRVIGMALRYFDVEIDLAPVVDIRGDDPPKGLERRTFGSDPDSVVELAGAFIRGLHETGTAACLKHFPGIGLGSGDPHYGATVMNLSRDEMLARDLVPFAKLGNEAGAIMVGHGTYPQLENPDTPATLSRRLTRDLLDAIGFNGLAVSDDMEMHAVSDLGSYESLAERALMAGNDIILFCSHIERVPDLQRALSDLAKTNSAVASRVAEAHRKAQQFRDHIARLRSNAIPPAKLFDDVIDEAIRFVAKLEETRPHREVFIPDSERRKQGRTPGKGRTGREEWT